MKKMSIFLKKTLQLLAVAAILGVTINANAQTIHYDFNGGTGVGGQATWVQTIDPPSPTVIPRTPASLELSYPGHVFIGWTSSIDFYPNPTWNGAAYNPPQWPREGVEEFTFTARWAEVIPGAPICADELYYLITGTYTNTANINLTVLSGAGSVTGGKNPPAADLSGTFSATYAINTADIGNTVRILIEFIGTDPVCDNEARIVQFIVNPLPEVPEYEITCEGTTGSIVIDGDVDHVYQLVPHGTPAGVDYYGHGHSSFSNRTPGMYDLYIRDITTGCIRVEENISIEDCCLEPIELNITHTGRIIGG